MNTLSQSEIRAIKAQFKIGARVKLDYMNDKQAVPAGTKGTVQFIDSIGTIHVAWDNGSSLGVVPGEDRCHVITETDTVESSYNLTD